MSWIKFILITISAFQPAYGLEGRIDDGVYVSPEQLFQVDVPTMRNPFVKKPSVIQDSRRTDGGQEVTFSVMELGEAWRYGVQPLPVDSQVAGTFLTDFSDQQLINWVPEYSVPSIVLEEEIQLGGGPGSLRIYHQEQASLLYKVSGSNSERETALIGVAVWIARSMGREHVLYVVGQFDMPMSQLRFFVEEVGMSKDKVLKRFASEHAKRLRELMSSFRLRRS